MLEIGGECDEAFNETAVITAWLVNATVESFGMNVLHSADIVHGDFREGEGEQKDGNKAEQSS